MAYALVEAQRKRAPRSDPDPRGERHGVTQDPAPRVGVSRIEGEMDIADPTNPVGKGGKLTDAEKEMTPAEVVALNIKKQLATPATTRTGGIRQTRLRQAVMAARRGKP